MSLSAMDHFLLNENAKIVANAVANANKQSLSPEETANMAGMGLAAAMVKAQADQEKNEIIDKYNELVKKYDVDMDTTIAARDYLRDVIRDNIDNLNITRDEINAGMAKAVDEAREAAEAKYK